MSKHLELWKQETGEESFRKFIESVFSEEGKDTIEERLRGHATTIYRNYKQNHDEKHFGENKIVSGAVVMASCALILLSRYFDLREKVQRPLEWMALASVLIFGAGFLYSLYQENEYKTSDKSEKYESDQEKHQKFPEVQTIIDELKAEAYSNKNGQTTS